KMTTWTVLRAWKPAKVKPRKRASKSPASSTNRMRRASRMSCSMMSRRRLRFCDLSRNSMAAQRIRRKRIRLIRWMMMGELIRAPPTIMLAGLRKSVSNIAGLYGSFHGHAMVQELGQHGIEVIAGADQRVIDALADAAPAHLDQVLLQGFQVAVA